MKSILAQNKQKVYYIIVTIFLNKKEKYSNTNKKVIGELKMRNTEKRILMCIICVLLLFGIIRIAISQKPKNTQKTVSEPDKTVYTVKDYNGRIAVFENDSETPSTVYDTPLTKELPISDRKKLQHGIKVSSKKELITLLQDYDN